MTNVDFENTILFEFDDEQEFITYCNLFKDQIGSKQVIWSRGTDYRDLFMKGLQLFEQKQHKKAIKTLESALDFNPIGLAARFEIAENHIVLKNYKKAREVLLEMKDMLTTNNYIARFYRRLGFICVEEEDYETAYACFVESGKYEKTQQAEQEIKYISSKATINKSIDVKKILEQNNIPLFLSKDASTEKATTQTAQPINDEALDEEAKEKEEIKETEINNSYPEENNSASGTADSTREKKKEDSGSETNNAGKPKRSSLIMAWVVACIAICGCIGLYSKVSAYENEIAEYKSQIASLNSKNTSLSNQLSSSRTKAGDFDKVSTALANKQINNSYRADYYYLKNPNKKKVMLYVSDSYAGCTFTPRTTGGVTMTWGDDCYVGSQGCPIYVTNNGISGTITIGNNYNSNKIVIFVEGK